MNQGFVAHEWEGCGVGQFFWWYALETGERELSIEGFEYFNKDVM